MSNAQFWTYLYLLIHMPYTCLVGVRDAGWQNMGANAAHGTIVYGGSCLQSMWVAFGHANLDWWAVGADV